MEDKIKSTITEMFPQLFKDNLNNFNSVFSSTETHNGVDSPRIIPENLLPYTINVGMPLIEGSIRMYDYALGQFAPGVWDYGIIMRIDNQSVKLDMADFYVSAIKTNTQTINTGANAIIIFDTIQGGLNFPTSTTNPNFVNNFYNTSTGIWDIAQSSWWHVDAIVTFAAGGTASGTFEIKLNNAPTNTLSYPITYPASDEKQTLLFSGTFFGTVLSGMSIKVTNNTPSNRTTVANETFLTVKQLK
jgi:hypothetical protein